MLSKSVMRPFAFCTILLSRVQAHQQSYFHSDDPLYNDMEKEWLAGGLSKQDTNCFDGVMAALAGGFGFDITNTDQLEKWVNDETKLNVFQIGNYEGLAEVKEYTNLLSSYIFQSFKAVPGIPSLRLNNITDLDNCDVDVAIKYAFEFDPSIYEAGSVEMMLGLSIIFNASDTGITLKTASGFAPSEFAGAFAGFAQPDKISENVCSIMEDECEDVWKANNLDQTSCREEFLALDKSEGDLHWVDGNSQGCRIIHSAFATENPIHCPHVSFKPIEDVKGLLKCQTSKNLSYEDVFSADRIDFYKRSAVYFELDESRFEYTPAPTSDCKDKPIFQKLVNRFI